MRAIVLEVTPADLARRRRIGADRWDEMWEGVLHMTPAPSREHQRIAEELIEWLRPLLRRTGRGQLCAGINVFRADDDYRVPDLTFVAAGHEYRLAEDGVRDGGPDAVIEIRSPNDETYEKLPFFAAIGTREVAVIDRDTKQPEVFRLAGESYLRAEADAEGWVESEVLAVRFRCVPGVPPHLEIADAADAALRHVI
ncbi:MAG: Uma2 family endonuclease [Armatimonadota bacterium]|nr:Uma2 family endonuclease [Armatimonadota bacterium]